MFIKQWRGVPLERSGGWCGEFGNDRAWESARGLYLIPTSLTAWRSWTVAVSFASRLRNSPPNVERLRLCRVVTMEPARVGSRLLERRRDGIPLSLRDAATRLQGPWIEIHGYHPRPLRGRVSRLRLTWTCIRCG